jgi:hypothetical protein
MSGFRLERDSKARDVGVSFGAPDEARLHHGEGCDQ